MPSPVPTVTAPEALRVLVVDDNASLLRFLVSAFSANGCTVSQAAAAEQALGLITAEPLISSSPTSRCPDCRDSTCSAR